MADARFDKEFLRSILSLAGRPEGDALLYVSDVPIAPQDLRGRRVKKKIVYAVTPSTAGKTYDFWCVARDHEVGDAEADTRGMKSQAAVLGQDVDALNLLEATLAGEPSGYQELSVNIDTGALAARRMLARLAEAGERVPQG